MHSVTVLSLALAAASAVQAGPILRARQIANTPECGQRCFAQKIFEWRGWSRFSSEKKKKGKTDKQHPKQTSLLDAKVQTTSAASAELLPSLVHTLSALRITA